MQPFQNREDAGWQIGTRLLEERLRNNALLLALPRGGIPVARAASDRTRLPWSFILARKLRSLEDPEFALGGIAEGGRALWAPGIKGKEEIENRARQEIKEQAEKWMHYKLPPISGRPVIVVDDGLATGWTARAVARRLRDLHAESVWGAFPVGPPETVKSLEKEFDKVICLQQPENFRYVGQFYKDFRPLSDEELGLPVKRVFSEPF